MNEKIIKICLFIFLITQAACLRTRSEVSEQGQNAIYGKKNAENQMEAQAAAIPSSGVDEKDELIRNLNGRVEVLENQLATLTKEKETLFSQDSQKIVLLQEALAKMEAQIHRLEKELPEELLEEPAESVLKSSDEAAIKVKPKQAGNGKQATKKLSSYEMAEQNFAKQEWKKAILNFQKYTDESPRGKNVADAKFKIGVCFQELGMKEEAMAFYEEVVANYSKTAAGKKSKSRLASLKKLL